ncbi:leucyl/phenylalanyl-tRNA--protein transferase [Winogradskyella sp.]|uniref:leucyl/phenylalanyl-tRNA--protein transferase n=1 Tax=Winogradskyella sp. TaxID=1883156 RepID=UPI0025FAA95B|nr:leucyl/phenylalanyl-tRNA--protein transferase [Winogradskyella sp.]MCT4628879.1 leucyl/phenylalanyl-tRNA--protein transferase [Winogradskyella sp.]
MHFLTDKIVFPDVSEALSDGLLAVGGDLSIERLIHAYASGIFPWFEVDEPLLWWSPDPRFVLFPKDLKISKSMKQVLKRNEFQVTVNKDFKSVIVECALTKRNGQESTWITNDMIEAYMKLHQLGYTKSVEVWQNNELVGGLYGVDLGNKVFCGESMFAKVSNASKAGFITFVQNSNYSLIDCQIHTKHLESLGAKHISRQEFLKYL